MSKGAKGFLELISELLHIGQSWGMGKGLKRKETYLKTTNLFQLNWKALFPFGQVLKFDRGSQGNTLRKGNVIQIREMEKVSEKLIGWRNFPAFFKEKFISRKEVEKKSKSSVLLSLAHLVELRKDNLSKPLPFFNFTGKAEIKSERLQSNFENTAFPSQRGLESDGLEGDGFQFQLGLQLLNREASKLKISEVGASSARSSEISVLPIAVKDRFHQVDVGNSSVRLFSLTKLLPNVLFGSQTKENLPGIKDRIEKESSVSLSESGFGIKELFQDSFVEQRESGIKIQATDVSWVWNDISKNHSNSSIPLSTLTKSMSSGVGFFKSKEKLLGTKERIESNSSTLVLRSGLEIRELFSESFRNKDPEIGIREKNLSRVWNDTSKNHSNSSISLSALTKSLSSGVGFFKSKEKLLGTKEQIESNNTTLVLESGFESKELIRDSFVGQIQSEMNTPSRDVSNSFSFSLGAFEGNSVQLSSLRSLLPKGAGFFSSRKELLGTEELIVKDNSVLLGESGFRIRELFQNSGNQMKKELRVNKLVESINIHVSQNRQGANSLKQEVVNVLLSALDEIS